MFNGLTNIIEVDLSKFDASLVINMYTMFCDCSSLKSINLEISILQIVKISVLCSIEILHY